MPKRFLLIAALVLSSTVGRGAIAAESQTPTGQNVLFILTEDQGCQLSHLGTPAVSTPNMDAIAKSGTYFRNAYVAYPVCSASKAALFTGLHSHTNGVLNNTANIHKPAGEVTGKEPNYALSLRNKIAAQYPTLTERLHEAGYHQVVTHKLHVVPNTKFPYDAFLPDPSVASAGNVVRNATAQDKPWFVMINIPHSHRPYPNSDQVDIGIDPADVVLPAFLADTPTIRKDWAEYLAGVEKADAIIGSALAGLQKSGQADRTIVVLMSDHGPCFQHGKMSLYDFGIRVPLAIRVPGMPAGDVDVLASELDVMPTLLDLLGLPPAEVSHGQSLRGTLARQVDAPEREYVFAEISHHGVLPNNGMQERCVTDGRYKLIYREKVETNWRQVNADLRDPKPWGNRSYHETIRVKNEFPEAFRVLAEMDPQTLGGTVHAMEFYDLQSDPDEMTNRIDDPAVASQVDRLYAALRQWTITTDDPAVEMPPR